MDSGKQFGHNRQRPGLFAEVIGALLYSLLAVSVLYASASGAIPFAISAL